MPLILDFDHTAGEIHGAMVINLSDWQDRIRFACTEKTFHTLATQLQKQMPEKYGTVLLGSGDYHHLSAFLIEQLKYQITEQESVQVVVFDNHPDNMRFPFGIHCGSWVSRVASLPHISHVHVLGITSNDIGICHAWENRLRPLYSGKLTYWCMDVDIRWARYAGLTHAFRRFDHPDALITAFLEKCQQHAEKTYLSIDKDVLCPQTVRTNWDQGRMQAQHLMAAINALNGHLIGSDITGEVSTWQYDCWWKRCLSTLDGQETIPQAQQELWQMAQRKLNHQLLEALGKH